MDNQHRKIIGYNEMSQAQIDMMNDVTLLGSGIEAALEKVTAHVRTRGESVTKAFESAEGNDVEIAAADIAALNRAQPERWLALARTDFQTALMKLKRAIAVPGFF